MNHLAKLAARGAATVATVRPRLPSLFEATPVDAAPPPESAPFVQPSPSAPDLSRRIVEVEEVLLREARIASEPRPATNAPPALYTPAPPPDRVERVERVERIETRPARAEEPKPPQSIVREKTTERVERTETRIVTAPVERTEIVHESDPHPAIETKAAPAPPPIVERERPVRRREVPIAHPASPAAPMFRREPMPEAAPTIHVTIGRVDVRAVIPGAPAPRTETGPRAPALSLEDYLAQRNRGGR